MLAAKARDEIRDDARAQRVSKSERDDAAFPVRKIHQFTATGFERAQSAVGMTQERLAVPIDLYRAPPVIEERDPQVPFQAGDGAAESRLGDSEFLGRLGDVLRSGQNP